MDTILSSDIRPPETDILLSDAIRTGDKERVRALASEAHAGESAAAFSRADDEDRIFFVATAGDLLPAQTLLYLEPDALRAAALLLGEPRMLSALDDLETDEAVQILEELPEDVREQAIARLRDARFAGEIRESLAFAEDSVGRMMHKNMLHLPAYWTVGQAVDYFRGRGEHERSDFTGVYLVDPFLRPLACISPSRILCAERGDLLKKLSDGYSLQTLYPEDDQEDAAKLFRRYSVESVPVINNNGALVGELTVDQIADVIDEEAQEDIMRLGGVGISDVYSPVKVAVRRRLPWLCVNLITAVTAALVVAFFETTIEQMTALAILMPIVAAMAGNAGTQTLTVVVRALSTEDISSGNALRVLLKEVRVGAVNGCVLAVLAGLSVGIIYRDASLGLLFGGAILGSLTIATAAGTAIPLILTKCGADPAVSSSVFLITVTDIAAFGLFLGFAAMFLL